MKRRSCLIAALAVVIAPLRLSGQDPPADSLAPPDSSPRRMSDSALLLDHPSRDLNRILTFVPGIALVDGKLYARGSRAPQLGYRLDGFSMLDRFTGENLWTYIPEALESVTPRIGVHDPSHGTEGGGVVDLRMKRGGETFSASAMYETDDYAPAGKAVLGTYAYGWNTAVATAGGPLPFGWSFFVAGQMRRTRDRTPTVLEPITKELATDPYASRPPGETLPQPLRVVRNSIPHHGSTGSTVQANIEGMLLGWDLRVIGAMDGSERSSFDWPDIVTNYLRTARIPVDASRSSFWGLTAGSQLSEKLSVEASVARTSVRFRRYDPQFGDDWRSYIDSAANANHGYGGFLDRYRYPSDYSVVYAFYVAHPSKPNNAFEKQERSSVQSSLGMRYAPSERWTVDVTFDAEWRSIRRFSIASIANYRWTLDQDRDGVDDRVFPSEDIRRKQLMQNGNIVNYGFSVDGTEVDGGADRDRRPFRGSASAMARWTDEGFAFSFGGSIVWLGNDISSIPADKLNQLDGNPPFDFNSGFIDESILQPTPVLPYYLPHVRMEYTAGSVRLHGGLRSSVDVQPLRDLYIGNYDLSWRTHPFRRIPYVIARGSSVLTYHARPERATIVEAGGAWAITTFLHVRVDLYRKYLTDQLELGLLPEFAVVGYRNTGESRVTGIEAGFSATLGAGFSIEAAYGWTKTAGYTSDPWGNLKEYTDEIFYKNLPRLQTSLLYQREHRLLTMLRFIAPGSSALSGLEAALYGTVESGVPYTKLAPPLNLGCCSPWFIGVRPIQDVRMAVETEPDHSSVTPFLSTWDLSLSYTVTALPVDVRMFVHVTNLFDRRNVVNVYPTTASATWDGWFDSPYSAWPRQFPGYEALYTYLNLRNRWAYMKVTGNDMLGPPRQVRIGMEVAL